VRMETAARSTGSLVAWRPRYNRLRAKGAPKTAGNLFYGPGVAVYEGMVIGENARPGDIPINVCRKKHLTNMRSSHGDMESG